MVLARRELRAGVANRLPSRDNRERPVPLPPESPSVKLFASLRVLLLSVSLCLSVAGAEVVSPAAEPPYYRVRYEPSDRPGELAHGVSYTVWIPPGIERLRGVIVHQHGCGVGACQGGLTAAHDWHWQALARQHGCALMGPSYEQPEGADCGLWCDPRNGSDARFRQALADLAVVTGHPELETVPWALWGHSGGGVWVGTMLMLHPERIVAVWLRSGTPRMIAEPNSNLPSMTIPRAALAVPVMANLGTQEGVTVTDGRFAGVWDKNRSFFLDLRGQGGLIGVAVDPNSSHDCGNSRYLAIPWFDACLAARLPNSPAGALREMPAAEAWLAPLLGHEVVAAADYQQDLAESVWLPNHRVAALYSAYVLHGEVPDVTPPPPPVAVRWAGDRLLWEPVADLESGIAGFIIERNGEEVARLPGRASGNVGRTVFQRTGYHDTPALPLIQPEFEWSGEAGEQAGKVSVRTINGVGLVSAATAVKN